MPVIVLFPLVQALGLLAFSAAWMTYMTYLATSGTLVKVTTSYPTGTSSVNVESFMFTYSDNARYAGWYLLFCYYWTSEFITALGQIIMAMAVSYWYFSRDKAKEIGNSTVSKSIRTTLRYHAGTAAFGSCIIAIIKLIRAIIANFQKKALKAAQKAKATGNPVGVAAAQVIMAVLCAVQCCMWCVEKCMKFLNKNAYIQTAIFGYSFCKAARKAFFLILRNILRIAAVVIVSEFVIILGLILIPLVVCFLSYLTMMNSPAINDELNGFVGPIAAIFVISYFTTKVLDSTYKT